MVTHLDGVDCRAAGVADGEKRGDARVMVKKGGGESMVTGGYAVIVVAPSCADAPIIGALLSPAAWRRSRENGKIFVHYERVY